MMKTAIVTGAGGFIGGALTGKLLEKGITVYGVDIREIPPNRYGGGREQRFIPVCADMSEGLPEVAEHVDAVFHLANGGQWWKHLNDPEFQIESIKTAVRSLQAISDRCDRFIFCGSTYEYMRSVGERQIEASIYGIAKRATAQMCAALAQRKGIGFNKVILTNTFGVGDKSDKAVNTIVGKMLDREPLSLVEGHNRNDWMYIDDTVDGLIAVAERGIDCRNYYIGHRKITTFQEKLIAMRDLLCPGMELKFGTMAENTYIDYDAIDLDVLYEDTGFEAKTEFADAIRRTAAWVNEMRSGNKRGGANNVLILPNRWSAGEAVAA